MLRQFSIRNKLAIVLWSAALFAFAVAAAALIIFEKLTLESRAHQLIEPYAKLVSVGADAAVAFEDSARAQEILNTLQTNPQIMDAAIVLEDGRTLASYNRIPVAQPSLHQSAFATSAEGIQISGDAAVLTTTLEHGGYLRISIGKSALRQHARQTLWLFGAFTLVLLVITFIQMGVLQRTLTRPIAALAEAAEKVRTQDNYQIPVQENANDEVARLGRSVRSIVAAVQQRESDLRRLTAFQRALLDNIADGIVSATPEGIVNSINPAATRLLGYTAEEVIGKLTPLAWHDPLEVEQRARQLSLEFATPVTIGFDVFKARAGRNLPDEHEWTFIRKDGTSMVGLLSVNALHDEQGRVTGFVGLIKDLTARNKAEEDLRHSQALYHSFVEQLPNPVFRKDAHNRFVMVNAQFCRLRGLSAEQLIGYTPGEVASRHSHQARGFASVAEYSAASERVHAQIMQTGKIIEREMDAPRAGGSPGHFDIIQMPVFDSSGTIVGTQGIIFDITERKQMEKHYLHSQRVEAVGTLASGVAHDLNNILSPIIMASELLADSVHAEDDRKILAMIKSSAQRGSGIIRQLLMFSRGVEGSRTDVQPTVLLQEMEQLMRETFPRNIAIKVDSPGDLWMVEADVTQLHQVLMNLCVNARDAMPDGGTLTLSARNATLSDADLHLDPRAKAGPYVVLTITDTGHGIAPEIAERIFDPFFTTKGVGKGSGLGLSTVLGIVKQHDGFVRMYTEPGRGTTFRVYLRASINSVDAASGAIAPVLPLGKGETILVVDDEAPLRELVSHLLEMQGYRVHIASDGQAAINTYQQYQHEIQLLLTDLKMPVMDGVTLIRVLKGMNPQLKVIASSGLDAVADREQLQAMGVQEIMMKPFERDALLQAVRRQLHA